MPYAFRHQPLKGLYLVYQLVSTLCVRVPLWVLLNTPSSWRPRKTWSLKRAFMVNVLRHFMVVTSETGPFIKLPSHVAITPGVDINGVWIGSANHLVTGVLKEWADRANVTSIRIPGYWIHKKGLNIKVGSPPQPGEKVILALHGGAYIRMSAHPTDPTAAIAKGLVKHVDRVSRVFSVEYRLAAGAPYKPAHPFPTQLLDALAGYNYLVNVAGFSPDDIILEGDSAGANLALALTRYLVEYQNTPEINLPKPPGALILCSPWADMGTTHEAMPTGSVRNNLVSDYVGGMAGDYAKIAFAGPHGADALDTNAYISPASLHPDLRVSFDGFPRTFIIGGGAEVLIDSIRTLNARMVKDLGQGDGVKEGDGQVHYHEVPDGIHDYLVATWHEPERTSTFREINKWVNAAI